MIKSPLPSPPPIEEDIDTDLIGLVPGDMDMLGRVWYPTSKEVNEAVRESVMKLFTFPWHEWWDIPIVSKQAMFQEFKKFLAPAPSSTSAPVPKFRNDNRDRVLGFKSQGSVNSGHTNPLCQKYGRNHQGDCRADNGVCFRYGKPDHQIRECRVVAQKRRDLRQ
ncbi:hypothetical protein FXO37_09120 [Capsicum annuum]|nr:hypothetical protein FXO37_09120 [Capsicum annuum]